MYRWTGGSATSLRRKLPRKIMNTNKEKEASVLEDKKCKSLDVNKNRKENDNDDIDFLTGTVEKSQISNRVDKIIYELSTNQDNDILCKNDTILDFEISFSFENYGNCEN